MNKVEERQILSVANRLVVSDFICTMDTPNSEVTVISSFSQNPPNFAVVGADVVASSAIKAQITYLGASGSPLEIKELNLPDLIYRPSYSKPEVIAYPPPTAASMTLKVDLPCVLTLTAQEVYAWTGA